MSLETLSSSREQTTSMTPETDRLLTLIKSRKPEYSNDDIAVVRSGIRMAGSGYAEVIVQYEHDRVEDGALDKFTKIYTDKLALHVPEDVKDELDDGDYIDILEEQAEAARNDAEMSVILAPIVAPVTVESMETPDAETLHRLKVAGLEAEIKERDTLLSEQAKEMARLRRQIEGLKERLEGAGDEDVESTNAEEDLDYYERSTLSPRSIGNAAIHDVAVE
jgi:uncharacterized coiled-coil protein SlyX